MICNFGIYFTSNYAIHDRLLIEIKTFLLEDSILLKFKSNCEISYLFYCLETYYNLEMSIDFFSNKKTNNNNSLQKLDSLNCLILQKHIVHFTDLLQIRHEILDIISAVMSIFVSDEILKLEMNVLLQNFCKKPIGPSFGDYFILIKKVLLKHLSRTTVFNSIPLEEILLNILSSLKENHFKMQSVKEVNDVENYSKAHTLDEFLAGLLELQLIFLWEKKDVHCQILKAIDFLLPKHLNFITLQLLFDAADKFKSMPAHFKLLEIVFKRLELVDKQKSFEILKYLKGEMQNSEEIIKYFSKKKILRFYVKSLQFQDKITAFLLLDINEMIIENNIEVRMNSAALLHEYLTYNQGQFFNLVIQKLNKILLKCINDKNLQVIYDKKEKFNCGSNLLQIFYILDDILPVFLKKTSQIIDFNLLFECVGLYFEFFKVTKLLYLTLPDIISFNNSSFDIKELWGSICQPVSHCYFKNGGVLFAFTSIILKLLNFSQEKQLFEQMSALLKVMSSIFLLDQNLLNKSPSPSNRKEIKNPLKTCIEESNTKFTKNFLKQIENFNEKNCHLSFNKKNEALMTKCYECNKNPELNEINIYHHLFYKLLKLLRKSQSNETKAGLLKVFRVSAHQFLLFLKNYKIIFSLIPLKNIDYKRKFDKESFERFGAELNEISVISLLKQNKVSTIMKSSKEDGETNSIFDEFVDFLTKFNENDKFTKEIEDMIRAEILPKIKFFFRKSIYFVKNFKKIQFVFF